MQSIRRKIKKTASTPKGRVVLLVISLVIVSAIAGGILYWRVYRKQIIREKLEAAVREKTKGLYAVHYDELKLDEVAGDLTVTNFTLSYDSLNYLRIREGGTAPPLLLRITIPSIVVSGVKTPRALLNKEIVGKKLQLDRPVIDIIYTNAGKDSVRNIPTREVYEQILGDLNLIRIDTLIINQAQIVTRKLKSSKEIIKMENTSVQLFDVTVDSAAWVDPSRLLFAKALHLQCDRLSWPSNDRPYRFSADTIELDSRNSTLQTAVFRVQPLLDEDAFVRSLPTQDDRFDFDLHGIAIRTLDFQKLFKEEIEADSLSIRSATFRIYRDLGIVRDKKNRVGTYPHQSIAKLAIPLLIRTMTLSNTFVEYKERSAKTRQAGRVRFNSTYATIRNITNRKEVAEQKKNMTVHIQTRFLDRAPLDLTWTFYLFNPNGRFDIKGSLGSMNASDLNVLAEPMGPARIEKGQINSLHFDLAGNDYSMNGNVQLLYEDLKVSLLEKDEDSKKLEKKKLASLAANIVIKNANPSSKKEEPRQAQVKNERDTNRSIFHLSWKTLFKGVKETAGINK